MKNILNNIFAGDCLLVLEKIPNNFIDMIYIDPPFFSQQEYKNTDKEGKTYLFSDSWASMDDYLNYLEKRFILLKEKLKETGSIFVHCDKSAVHYIKILLDRIFGYENFKNEIIWSYKKWTNIKQSLQNNHQNILFYSKKNNKNKFNTILTDYSPTTNLDQILNKRKRDNRNKSIYSEEIIHEKKGVALGDVWEIPYLNPKARERTGYPTQKPIILLERLIKISTDVSDVILDPFCGSGTTLIASKILKRNYIGIDISKQAVDLSTKRLSNPIKTTSNLLLKGYDSYVKKDERLKKLSDEIDIKIIQRNSNADGFINSEKGLIAIKLQDDINLVEKSIYNIKEFCLTKKIERFLVVTENKIITHNKEYITKNSIKDIKKILTKL